MPSTAKLDEAEKSLNPGERLNHVTCFIEKKIRSLDKRKNKLENIKSELASGKKLEIGQVNAVEAYDTVVSTLDLCRHVVQQLQMVIEDRSAQEKNDEQRKFQRRTKRDGERLEMGLRFQDVLEQLSDEKIRDDFLAGNRGAVKLDEAKIKQLLDLREIISMPPGDKRSNNHIGLKEQNNIRSVQFGLLLDGANKPWQDTTFKSMKMLLYTVANCPYPKILKPKKERPPRQTKQPIQNKQASSMLANQIDVHNQQEAGLLNQEAGMLNQEAGLLNQEAGLLNQEAGMLNQEAGMLNQEAGLLNQEAGMLNQEELLSNGFPVNPSISYEQVMPIGPSMAGMAMGMQSSYYNQNRLPPLEIHDLMLSSNINFLQESQLSPEPAAVYMDPAVVSFGTIQPESLMQMHEQQMSHLPTPNISTHVVHPQQQQQQQQQFVYQATETKECQPPVEQVPPPQPKPVMTSWADDSNDRWPNEINGESNVWNSKPDSMNWTDDMDDRRGGYRGKPANRRINYGGGYNRGRGSYGGNYTNSNRNNSFGYNGSRGRGNNGNGFQSARGINNNFSRGTTYRGYRGGFQSQPQRT